MPRPGQWRGSRQASDSVARVAGADAVALEDGTAAQSTFTRPPTQRFCRLLVPRCAPYVIDCRRMELSVIVPCLNEEPNVPELVNRIGEVFKVGGIDAELLLI